MGEIAVRTAGTLLSWRMANDERALTGMKLTPQGVTERGG